MGFRFPALALGMSCLLTGLWAGVTRLGWELPVTASLPLQHGPLMVSGFLGTLISLERAVAVGRPPALLAPILTGLGMLTCLLNPSLPLGPWTMTLGSLGLVLVSATLWRRQPSLGTALAVTASALWLAGNTLWALQHPVHRVVLLWIGFLVLTIVAERLELSRFIRSPEKNPWGLYAGLGLLIVGLPLSLLPGARAAALTGLGMGMVAFWLLRHDLARHGLRQAGQIRFTALSLLGGYVWLAGAGIFLALFGRLQGGPRYDAVLHALLVGFVISLVFGHAPIIFPTLLRRQISFRYRLYVPLLVLHISLLLRVLSDLGGWWGERGTGEGLSGLWLRGQQWGGLLNALSILLFMLLMLTSLQKRPN